MPQYLFAQTMPLSGAGPSFRRPLVGALNRRQHPSLVAIGSSCHVQSTTESARAPLLTASSSSGEALPRRCGGAADAPRTMTSANATKPPAPWPPCKEKEGKVMNGLNGEKLQRLLVAEQMHRWELRYEEQAERVDLALLKASPHPPLGSRSENSTIGASPSDCFPSGHLPPRARTACMPDARGQRHSAASRTVLKDARATSQQNVNPAKDSSDKDAFAASSHTSSCVRDSELLRALQRAETRIQELETELGAATCATNFTPYPAAVELKPERKVTTATESYSVSAVGTAAFGSSTSARGTQGYAFVCPRLSVV